MVLFLLPWDQGVAPGFDAIYSVMIGVLGDGPTGLASSGKLHGLTHTTSLSTCPDRLDTDVVHLGDLITVEPLFRCVCVNVSTCVTHMCRFKHFNPRHQRLQVFRYHDDLLLVSDGSVDEGFDVWDEVFELWVLLVRPCSNLHVASGYDSLGAFLDDGVSWMNIHMERWGSDSNVGAMIRSGVFQGSAERVGDLDQGSSAELSVFRDLHDIPHLKYGCF